MISSESKIKLDLVQIKGIVKLILEKVDEDFLQIKIENLFDIEVKDVRKALGRLNRKQLIEMVEQLSEIEDDDITKVFELYRYGQKPGFNLCYIGGKCKDITEKELVSKLITELEQQRFQDGDKFKNIKYRNIERISSDTIEISLTYLAKYSYISDVEKPSYIYALKDTFVWINIIEGYIAIRNCDKSVIMELKTIFSRIYDTKVIKITITRTMINDIFGNNKIKKGTFFKPNASEQEPQKVIISDSKLAEKKEVMENFVAYDMTSSVIEEEIGEDIVSKLGINCKNGSIYLTKNLNATEFREWSLKRIKDVIDYMKMVNVEDWENFRIKNIMDYEEWNGYSSTQKIIIEKIIFSLYCCKKKNLDSIQIKNTITEIFEKCFGVFISNLIYECDECNEICVASCSFCNSSSLVIAKNKRIMCTDCGHIQDGRYVLQCDEGHNSSFVGIERIVGMVPQKELLDKINKTLKNLLDIECCENESFYIYDEKLTILKRKRITELINVDDIPEFKELLNIEIERNERDILLNRFKVIQEKCDVHKNFECNRCKYSNNKCIMQLFAILGFRPSPHQNSEFGDVNLSVTYKGKKMRLVGIAKSKLTGEVLTPSNNAAREMLQQVFKMTQDKRAEIIAVICPMRFHPQLAADLEYLAHISGVNIMYFDDEFMIRLLRYNEINDTDYKS